jgi:hypothetical protein
MVIVDESSSGLAVIFEFGTAPAAIDVTFPGGLWRLCLNSSDEKWRGPGNPMPAEIKVKGSFEIKLAARSFVVFERLNSIAE